MGKKSILSQEERVRIQTLADLGHNHSSISRTIGRSRAVIRSFLNDPEYYGTKRRGGRKVAVSVREKMLLVRTARNSRSSAKTLGLQCGITASVRVIQRILKAEPTIIRRKLKKKPLLSTTQRKNRVIFAEQHILNAKNWKHVIFSDEKKFNLDGPDGYQYYWHDIRDQTQYLSKRHSCLGSVMIWGGISYDGILCLEVMDGRQTGSTYKSLLSRQFDLFNGWFGPGNWEYQHDNAPIHTAREVKDFIEERGVDILEWPSVSPDLNIIENVWSYLSRKVYAEGSQYNTRNELIFAINREWELIPLSYIRKLYESIPRRLLSVITNHGGPINY